MQSSAPAAQDAAAPSLFEQVKSLARRFPMASSSMLSLIDQMTISGTSFVTAMIIARQVSTSELGLYYLTWSIVMVLSGIQEQVISAPYVIYSKRRRGRELAEYTSSSWFHFFVLCGMAMAVLFVAASGLTMAGAAVRTGLWVLIGAAPMLLLREVIRRYALADLRVTTAILVDVPVAAIQIGGLLVWSHFGRLSLWTIFGTMALACATACLGWFLLSRPKPHFKRARFLADWRGNWPFAKWALQSYLIGNTTPYIMPWILSAAAGTAATGILGGCMTLIGVANMFATAVANVLTPHAAQAFVSGGSKQLARVLLQTALLLAVGLGTFGIAMTVVGEQVAVLIFGEHFAGSGPILIVLSISALMVSMNNTAGNGLWAIDQPRLNVIADFWCISMTLLAAALLILPLGALGAALATLAGTTSSAISRTWMLVRRLQEYARLEAAHALEAGRS